MYCNGQLSRKQPIRVGVPQGSSLGPTLFLVFINDFPNILHHCKCHLSADDTTLYSSAPTTAEAKSKLEHDLLNAAKWFSDNKLTLNISKSTLMAIGSSRRIGKDEITLTINDCKMTAEASVKLLGVILDSNLSWCSHVDHIVKKVSPKIGLLSRLRHTLPSHLLNTINKTIILPHFDYCNTVWGNCCKKYQIILQRLQNRCARIVTGNYDFTVHSSSLLRILGWQSLETRRSIHLSSLMFKCINGMAPQYLSTKFHFAHEVHNRNTRNSVMKNLYVPRPKTETFKQSLAYIGSTTWNSLPAEIRNAESLYCFKQNLKRIHSHND